MDCDFGYYMIAPYPVDHSTTTSIWASLSSVELVMLSSFSSAPMFLPPEISAAHFSSPEQCPRAGIQILEHIVFRLLVKSSFLGECFELTNASYASVVCTFCKTFFVMSCFFMCHFWASLHIPLYFTVYQNRTLLLCKSLCHLFFSSTFFCINSCSNSFPSFGQLCFLPAFFTTINYCIWKPIHLPQ